MKQLVFRIKNNGEIVAETKGIKGKSCLKYVNEMERLAKAITNDSEFTKEYYENEEHLESKVDEEVNA